MRAQEEGKQHSLLTDRQPLSRPLPALSPKSLECPSILPSHSPSASSFFPAAGDKKGKGCRASGCSPLPAPLPHARWPAPALHGKGQDRLLAGHSLVEVDVAQVLGRLLRGTHFLVVVDHPSGKVGGGGKG